MIDTFRQHVKKELSLDQEKVVLAVSGGVDSICMVYLFEKLRLNYCIAHCNFKLRGEDADRDEELVKKLAIKNNVDFFNVSFDTYAHSRDWGMSIQMTARKLRYDWLRNVKAESGSKYIATAHHLNDSLETALFNLSKGTGIAGIKGISAKVDDLIRPLLFATKDEIQTFSRKEGLSWREDSSNQSIKYQRNFIRHQIVSGLKERVNPSIERTFQDTAERIRSAEFVYQNHISELKRKYFEVKIGHRRLDISWVQENHHVPMVYELIKEFGFNFKQTKEVFSTSNLSGASFYSENHWLVKDRNQLIITDLGLKYSDVLISQEEMEFLDGKYRFKTHQMPREEVKISYNPEVAYLDWDKLEFPLKIRSWEEGDRFQPLGLKGKKKVSDFMIDQKIPVNLKKQVRILTSGNRIAWIIGMRIDDYFKITDNTRQVYCLKIEKPNA